MGTLSMEVVMSPLMFLADIFHSGFLSLKQAISRAIWDAITDGKL